MSCVAPAGGVYQAGTLSGNPVATAAGLATLRILRERREEIYPALEEKGAFLEEAFREAGVPVARVGSILTPFFAPAAPRGYEQACACDRAAFACYFSAMLDAGEYVAPSQFEAMFVSSVHTKEHLRQTAAAIGRAVCTARHDR